MSNMFKDGYDQLVPQLQTITGLRVFDDPRNMNPNLKPWTDAERALLGTSPDREVAAAIGRTIHAVRCERRNRKIPAFGVIT